MSDVFFYPTLILSHAIFPPSSQAFLSQAFGLAHTKAALPPSDATYARFLPFSGPLTGPMTRPKALLAGWTSPAAISDKIGRWPGAKLATSPLHWGERQSHVLHLLRLKAFYIQLTLRRVTKRTGIFCPKMCSVTTFLATMLLSSFSCAVYDSAKPFYLCLSWALGK